MLSLMPFTPRYVIFYAIYPKLCYPLCHIPRSSAIFSLNVMLQYITLTPSYANSSYAMFSGQSWWRISGYCCNPKYDKRLFIELRVQYNKTPSKVDVFYINCCLFCLVLILASICFGQCLYLSVVVLICVCFS